MKKILIAAIVSVFGNSAFSQTCQANDSTLMGAGAANDVFYSLSKAKTTGDGTVKVESNTNWHLAFSVLPSQFPTNPGIGVAIRVNSPLGENAQAGTTGCALKVIPGANFSNWHNLDTTGLYALPELSDNDSTWNLSSFTKGYSLAGDPFNFVWGSYNQTSHNVNGTKVFVLYNKSQNWYKKIFINACVFDTMWNFTVANIDNTDSNFVTIDKNSHKKRNFMYYDVINNTVIDREPDNDTWDLLWTKYRGMVPAGPTKIPYTVTGVLQNLGVQVAQNDGKKCSEVWLANKTAQNSGMISTIGYDWKTFNGTSYTVTDTFVYFVTGLDAKVYKMTLISYKSSLGKTVLSFYEATLGINDSKVGNVAVYPNPVFGTLNIDTKSEVNAIKVYDLFGKLVESNNNSSTIDISSLVSGMYLVMVETAEGTFQQRVIKQ